ncbi:MAG: hypothetical protein E2O69_07405, partial [Deltaproteobacteria bacterium]
MQRSARHGLRLRRHRHRRLRRRHRQRARLPDRLRTLRALVCRPASGGREPASEARRWQPRPGRRLQGLGRKRSRVSDAIHAIRAAAGLFRLARRGLICVEGGDRVRWLDGMLSNDVASLEPGPDRSGCPALLLTRTGRIQADPQVVTLGDDFWLELDGDAVSATLATLDQFIIADDVSLRDCSAGVERLALEGPMAPRIVDELAGRALGLARDAAIHAELAGVDCVVGAWGVSAMEARQLFVPSGSGEHVIRALLEVGAPWGLVEADPDSLEILRIEAGVPRLGAELDEEVLPPEARLERALSFDKG